MSGGGQLRISKTPAESPTVGFLNKKHVFSEFAPNGFLNLNCGVPLNRNKNLGSAQFKFKNVAPEFAPSVFGFLFSHRSEISNKK